MLGYLYNITSHSAGKLYDPHPLYSKRELFVLLLM